VTITCAALIQIWLDHPSRRSISPQTLVRSGRHGGWCREYPTPGDFAACHVSEVGASRLWGLESAGLAPLPDL